MGVGVNSSDAMVVHTCTDMAAGWWQAVKLEVPVDTDTSAEAIRQTLLTKVPEAEKE